MFMMKLPAKVGVLVLDLLAAVLVLYSVSLIFLSNFNMGNLMVWLLTACVAGYAVFRRPLSLWFSAGAGRVVFWVLAVLAGVYLALIVVNCIILGRAEMFACKNNVVDSALDGVGMGLGYTLTATLMASIREILGSGTWLGFQIIPESVAKVSIMTQAPGAFFCFGLLMAGCVWLEGKLDARIERKSCCDLDNLKKEAE